MIIPDKLRKIVLKELHVGHQGMVKMKALARKYVWWPKMDAELEQVSRARKSCQMEQKNTTLGSFTPLGIPRSELEKTAYRLCWSLPGTHIYDNCGCIFEVVGGISNA